MVSLPRNELWDELEKAKWYPLVSLGSQWLGKWTSSSKGYSVMVTDGIDVWGEQRNSIYIEEKAQEWAACLEAGIAELALLFLSQLEGNTNDIRISFDDHSDKLTIELTSFLDSLPYSWLFYLTKLHGRIVERHWTIPIAATLELLSVQITKLEEELKKKTRQLEEYLPSQPNRNTNALLNASIDISVQNILVDGIGTTFSKQLSNSSSILLKLDDKRKELSMSQHLGSQPHNRPKLKKTMKGVFSEEDVLDRQKAEEATRRAEIQALTQASILQAKKKKKLNI